MLDLLTPEMRRMGLFPVGRLDKDTSGLLLLTDDGEFAHRVISPKSCVKKCYYAEVEGEADEEDAAAFSRGIVLKDGTQCLPAELELLGGAKCIVTVMEGKYHQVRRMLASRVNRCWSCATVHRRAGSGRKSGSRRLERTERRGFVQSVQDPEIWEKCQKKASF